MRTRSRQASAYPHVMADVNRDACTECDFKRFVLEPRKYHIKFFSVQSKPVIAKKGELQTPDPAAGVPIKRHFSAARKTSNVQLSTKQVLNDSLESFQDSSFYSLLNL